MASSMRAASILALGAHLVFEATIRRRAKCHLGVLNYRSRYHAERFLDRVYQR
jgi:hypothetical protein